MEKLGVKTMVILHLTRKKDSKNHLKITFKNLKHPPYNALAIFYKA